MPGGGQHPPLQVASARPQHADAAAGPGSATGVAFSILPAAGLVGGRSESGGAAPVIVAAAAAAASARVRVLLRAVRTFIFASFCGGASKEVCAG